MEEAREEWGRLAGAGAASLFCTPEWLIPWWRHLGDEFEPWVVRLRRDGEAVALALLMRREVRRWGIVWCRVAFMGEGLADSGDLILADGDHTCVDPLLSAIDSSDWDVLDLREVRQDSRLVAWFSERAARRGLQVAVFQDSACPILEIRGGWEEFEARQFASKTRYEWRRREQRLRSRGNVAIEVLERPEEVRSRFEELVRLERTHSPKVGRGQILFNDPRTIAFLREALERVAERGWLRLVTLSLDGRLVAYLIGFLHRQEFLNYNTGYDGNLSSLGPGALVLRAAVRRAHEEGARRFDFLRGTEEYKLRWTSVVRRQVRLVVTRRGLRGRLVRRYYLQRRGLSVAS